MNIGIDARLIEETGVGRYIRNLIDQLGRIDHENHYVVFLKKQSFDSFILPNNKWEKRLAEVPWHSVTEQFVMPWILTKEHLDLVHVPYFTIPIFYPGKLIVTIHDLTILHFDTGKATTLPLPLYKVRRLGYYLVLAVGLIRASHILAVSEATKKEIIDHFPIPPEKITVTHEGIDKRFTNYDLRRACRQAGITNEKPLVLGKYFLYVGNAYPHKNLETLIAAFGQLKEHSKLVLVGKEDYFYRRLKKLVADSNLSDRVVFFGQANDQTLTNLYRHAIALVFPSLMEGFGLPAIEALSLGCPVICSDIPVFHEILGEYAIYVDPTRVDDLGSALVEVMKRKPSAINSDALVKRFSWKKMTEQTLDIYNKLRN